MANPNYEIDYNDKRFTQVEAEKDAALSDLEQTYSDMINKSDKFYQDQIDALDKREQEQIKIQNEQTDFAIQKIEQQQEQAKKDYLKEQSGAYVDWKKQSDPYGVNAEKMAGQGLQNSGYSESSQVSMWNAYQNRAATARESYNQIVMNFANNIKEAQLQNSSILAEIAFETEKQQLALALQGFQYNNTLLLEKLNQKTQVETNYYQRYQDVLAQINHENSLAEQIRQHNEEMAYKNATLAEDMRQFNVLHSGSGGYSGGSSDDFSGDSSSGIFSKATSAVKKATSAAVDKQNATNQKNMQSAKSYINALIKSGATKDRVANEISLALSEGALTQAQATQLRKKYAL